MIEQWRSVPGFEGSYEVSDHGRVRSLDRLVPGKAGAPTQRLGRIMRTGEEREVQRRYRSVELSGTTYYVHALVLLAFVGDCPEGQQCRHLDGNTENNLLSNLRWGTPVENTEDRRRHGTMCCGERSHYAVLSAADVLSIRLRTSGNPPKGTQAALAREYNVHRNTIGRIVSRRSWSHLPEEN